MKKWIVAGFLPFLLVGCGSSDYVHSKEPRSTVYYGQPVADLYENFGTPTKATRISDNERILIYISQEIEKDWAYRYVRGCIMQFRLVDNRVVDWSADGQACVIQSREGGDMSVSDRSSSYDEGGLFDSAISSSAAKRTVYRTGDQQVPADAFHGQAPTTYSTIPSVTTPSGVTMPENAVRGKASASWSRSGQLPADAFDGKASTTYMPTGSGLMNGSSGVVRQNGVAQVPADAFHGQASTIYTSQTQSVTGRTMNNTSVSSALGGVNRLPADAFDGKAATNTSTYQNSVSNRTPIRQSTSTTQPVYQSSSKPVVNEKTRFYDDEDEWGLFD